MKRILVFGGAGYIGSHTCKALHGSGFAPVVFDNFIEGHRDFVKWGTAVEGDIRDAAAVAQAFAQVDPVAAIHFAAHAYVGESVTDPGKYYDNNVSGSLNIAMAARDAGNVPLVFSSTCAIYGTPDVVAIREDTPPAPINPYGRTKLIVEGILQDFSSAYGLRSVCLRYFNACGADAEGEIGEAHREETHLVPRTILSALGRMDGFRVFGDDYDTQDGSAVRDYVHVTDLAHAHVLACDYLLNGGASDQFNIGSGKGTSVFQIIEAVRKATGRDVPHDIGPRRPGDPAALVADPAKARAVLGFQARHSDIANIAETATRWHLANS